MVALSSNPPCAVPRACRQLAKEEKVQAVAGMAEQLRQAAELLEGPWQHTEGEKPPAAEPRRQQKES
jgi:hypothetical protein